MAVDEIRSVVGEFGSAGAAIWRDVQDEARRNSDMLLRQVAVGLEDVKALFAQEVRLDTQIYRLSLHCSSLWSCKALQVR